MTVNLVALKNIKSKEELAQLLDIRLSKLTHMIWRKDLENRYISFKIRKKSGGFREIQTPKGDLMKVQKRLLGYFEKIYTPKDVVHGFAKSKSILTNAKQHLSKDWVLNFDIEDFFPSINFGRVRGVLKKVLSDVPDDCITIMAAICCHKGQLPQGAPTSPIVSNMICRRLDRELKQFARSHGCKYSRYADDITFSGNSYLALDKIVERFPNNMISPSLQLRNIFTQNNFQLNESKSRIAYKYSRQEVTGLIVNKKLNVKREYIMNLKAILHDWKVNGLEKAEKKFQFISGKGNNDNFVGIIKGKIDFLGMVRGSHDNIYQRMLNSYLVNHSPRKKKSQQSPTTSQMYCSRVLSGIDPAMSDSYDRIWENFNCQSPDSTGAVYKDAMSGMRELLTKLLHRYSAKAKNSKMPTRNERTLHIISLLSKREREKYKLTLTKFPSVINDLNRFHGSGILSKEDCETCIKEGNNIISALMSCIETLEKQRKI